MKKLLLILSLIVIPVLSHAQSGGFGGAFTRMGFGPRGMAMGNAMSSVHDDGVFAHYNPALASFSYKKQFDASTALLSFDRSLNQVNFSTVLPPSAGFSIMLTHASVQDIDGRSNSGYRTQSLSTNDFLIHSVFGIRLSNKFHAGVGFRLIYSDLHPDVSSVLGAGFDFGVLYRVNAHWQVSFALQDLLTNLRYDTTDLYGSANSTGEPVLFPTRMKLGASWRDRDRRLLFTADYELLMVRADVMNRTVMDNFGLPRLNEQRERTLSGVHQLRMGTRWVTHERFTIRAGLQLLNLEDPEAALSPTAGFSLNLPFDTFSPSIDYAYVLEPGMIFSMHVFSLRLNF